MLWVAQATVALWLSASVASVAFALPNRLEVYTRPGCPRCEQAEAFLEGLAREREGLFIARYDVTRDAAALERLRELAAREGIGVAAVPAFSFGNELLVGFDPAITPERIRALLGGQVVPFEQSNVCSIDPATCEAPATPAAGYVDLPLFGRINVHQVGLPLFTVVIGLVDGFNPCATWVLLFLLAMLVNLKSRTRMALIAGAFVLVSGIVYFAFMAAWLTFFTVLGISRLVRIVIALIALGVGFINVKDFIAFGRGPSLSIPDAAKPGFYARVRAIVRAENLTAALAGIVVLAFLVNLVELLCTAGLPALYTAVLTSRGLPAWQHYAYLTLYIAAYILDDSIMVTIGVVTLSKRKLQERGGRWLKLMSGLIVITLGLLLLARPEWLGF